MIGGVSAFLSQELYLLIFSEEQSNTRPPWEPSQDGFWHGCHRGVVHYCCSGGVAEGAQIKSEFREIDRIIDKGAGRKLCTVFGAFTVY